MGKKGEEQARKHMASNTEQMRREQAENAARHPRDPDRRGAKFQPLNARFIPFVPQEPR